MKRKRNTRLKKLILIVVFIVGLFVTQKLVTKKWVNGNTHVSGQSEDGVHIQDNETSEKQLKIPALRSKGMTK